MVDRRRLSNDPSSDPTKGRELTHITIEGVTTFLGNPIDDVGERRLINRLRRDLEQRGVSAILFANFVTTGRSKRQIDLLVLTPQRLVHCEIKVFDQHSRIVGGINGRWKQVLLDGTERELGENPFNQSQSATLAISDVMRALARAGRVPPSPRFYKLIDTVVCVDPMLPPGSELATHTHIDVIGYAELVDRLTTPAPSPPWKRRDWEEFARHLGVYRESPTSSEATSVRVKEEAVADYRRRYCDLNARDLHAYSPVGLEHGRRVDDS